jgi:hypothetical protein
MIEHDDIIAAGVPINIPKWQEIDTWLEELGEGRSWFGG